MEIDSFVASVPVELEGQIVPQLMVTKSPSDCTNLVICRRQERLLAIGKYERPVFVVRIGIPREHHEQ